MRRHIGTIVGGFALVVITALITLAVTGGFSRKATPPTAAPWNYKPANVTTQEMFASLSPASPEVAAAVKVVAGHEHDPLMAEAAKHVYVAHSDVALTSSQTPITVILPGSTRWTGGQLGNTVIFRSANATPASVEKGAFVFSDPMCYAEFLGAAKGVCNNVEAQRPGDWNEMTKHLRRATEPEAQKWLGQDYVAGDAHLYYVATSNFTAAPSYKFDGGDKEFPGETLGIFVPPGIKVLGGQLGYMDLYPLNADGTMKGVVTDSLCFMNDVPVISDDHTPNYGKTGTFAPEIETQRVSGCTRPKA